MFPGKLGKERGRRRKGSNECIYASDGPAQNIPSKYHPGGYDQTTIHLRLVFNLVWFQTKVDRIFPSLYSYSGSDDRKFPRHSQD